MTFSKKNREIILDTETTGLNPDKGDRIVDIACIELIDYEPTGRTYQVYLNPETQKMNPQATVISGITDEFLLDKLFFRDIVEEFLEFIEDSTLVIHNAKFDIAFLNSELKREQRKLLKLEETIDTLDIAHKKFPGAKASLDALCARLNVDTSIRSTHGALVDCKLLLDVYLKLIDKYKYGLFSFDEQLESQKIHTNNSNISRKSQYKKRTFKPQHEEIAEHIAFIEQLAQYRK